MVHLEYESRNYTPRPLILSDYPLVFFKVPSASTTFMQPLGPSLNKTAVKAWINSSMGGGGNKSQCPSTAPHKAKKVPCRFVFHPWVSLWTNTWEEQPRSVSCCQAERIPRMAEVWGEVLWDVKYFHFIEAQWDTGSGRVGGFNLGPAGVHELPEVGALFNGDAWDYILLNCTNKLVAISLNILPHFFLRWCL